MSSQVLDNNYAAWLVASNQTFQEIQSGDEQHSVDWAHVTREIASGNIESFSCYYEHFFDLMYCDARRLTGMDESSCLDIVQTAMLKAIGGMKAMRDQAQLIAWTRVVIRNSALDCLRKRARRMERELLTDVIEHNGNADLFPLQARAVWVEQQLKKAEPELRKMVALRYRWGWTLQQVAAKFGLKTGAVDGRIRRAVEKLRRQAELEFHE